MLLNIAEFIQKSGLRKITSGLYMFSVVSYLVYLKAIDGEIFKAIAIVIVSALMAGNAFEHHTKSKPGGKPDAKPAPSPAAPAVGS